MSSCSSGARLRRCLAWLLPLPRPGLHPLLTPCSPLFLFLLLCLSLQCRLCLTFMLLTACRIGPPQDEELGDVLKGKSDTVVFCDLSEVQRDLYQRVLSLPEFQLLARYASRSDCETKGNEGCLERPSPRGNWDYVA